MFSFLVMAVKQASDQPFMALDHRLRIQLLLLYLTLCPIPRCLTETPGSYQTKYWMFYPQACFTTTALSENSGLLSVTSQRQTTSWPCMSVDRALPGPNFIKFITLNPSEDQRIENWMIASWLLALCIVNKLPANSLVSVTVAAY